MSLDTLKSRLPEYAKDLRLNLSTLATETVLNVAQRAGTFIAAALASRNAELTREIVAEFQGDLSPKELIGAKAAATIMGMNNVYYRFAHLVGGDYLQMPPRLRMNVMNLPGLIKTDFELWSLAVSAINGCGMCMESHEKMVRHGGLTREQVQAAVRIAATVHAIAAVLDGEDAMAAGQAVAA